MAPALSVQPDIPDRIIQLERLVTSLMAAKSPKPASDQARPHVALSTPTAIPRHEEDSGPRSSGTALGLAAAGLLNQSNDSTEYVESTHWSAILDQVRLPPSTTPWTHRYQPGLQIPEVKGELPRRRGPTEIERWLFTTTAPGLHSADVIFAHYPRLNKQELIAALPPRQVVDMLVEEFFSNKAIESVVIHRPSFLREYERFWEAPAGTGTQIPWIGLLYAITRLSLCYLTTPTLAIPDPQRLIQVHREKIIQTLALSDYTSSPPLTIETLLVFLLASHQRDDADISSSLLLSMLIKLAQQSGYHRDPSQFPHLSPLQGEMRRRVWALIVQLDALSSIALGLPRTIRKTHYDTREPSNLFDGDVRADDEMLPLPRPDTVHSPAQFLVVRNKMLDVYGTVSDLVTSVSQPNYNEVMALEMSLHNAYNSIPSGLRIRAMSDQATASDAPELVIRCIYIALLFEEARCVLHQRFAREYVSSRATCIEAAIAILGCQRVLEAQTQAGGALFQERWRIERWARNGFLLAASILCVEVSQLPESAGQEETHARQEMIEALEQSCKIWMQIESVTPSADAMKVVKTVNLVLGKNRTLPASAETGTSNPLNPPPHGQREHPDAPPKGAPLTIHQLMMHNYGAGVDYSGISPASRP